jgi:hypothetical protein
VHTELGKVLGERRRIDLIIATHYDADHLDGLVPIILDDTIDIGQVWLPPVADDTLDERHGRPHRPEDLLGERMLNAEDGAVSASYKQRKQANIMRIEVLERAMDSESTTRVDPEPSNEGSDDLDGYFRTIWNAYRAKMPWDGCEHAPSIQVEEDWRWTLAWDFDELSQRWWITRNPIALSTQGLAEAIAWVRPRMTSVFCQRMTRGKRSLLDSAKMDAFARSPVIRTRVGLPPRRAARSASVTSGMDREHWLRRSRPSLGRDGRRRLRGHATMP